MTSYLSTLTASLPSMEAVSSYIPSKEDVTAGFEKVQDATSKAWKTTSETFADGVERARTSYEKLDPKTRKYLENSAIAAAVVSASALAYVNRQNISNGASALVDSSKKGFDTLVDSSRQSYKAISDRVAAMRSTEKTEEAFDLATAQTKLKGLQDADKKLSERISNVNTQRPGGEDKKTTLKAERTQVRAQIKALEAKIKEQAV